MADEGIAETGISHRTYRWLVGLIVLNHLVLDPVLTVYRVHTPPGAYELNPVWRGMIQTDPLVFLALQVPVILIVVGGFAFILRLVEDASQPWNRWSMVAVWWTTLIIVTWGLLSTAHHLWYIGHR